jgi:hypothetical protein
MCVLCDAWHDARRAVWVDALAGRDSRISFGGVREQQLGRNGCEMLSASRLWWGCCMVVLPTLHACMFEAQAASYASHSTLSLPVCSSCHSPHHVVHACTAEEAPITPARDARTAQEGPGQLAAQPKGSP